MIMEEKSHYFTQKILEAKNSGRELFKTVKNLANIPENSPRITSPDFCNSIGQFFIDKVTPSIKSFQILLTTPLINLS